MTAHTRLDIKRWEEIFSLDRLRDDARQFVAAVAAEDPAAYASDADKQRHIDLLVPRPEMVWGPKQIAVVEQLRRESAVDRGRAVPIDVCVWGAGEPSVPFATKIGGVPYRPLNRPWPVDKKGRPLGFLAQFCFIDSHQALPIAPSALPGDVMLVFVPRSAEFDHPEVYSDNLDVWTIEWCRIGEGRPDHRQPPFRGLSPAYAELHRSVDYPEDRHDDGLDLIQGGKIGGSPVFLQGDPGLLGVHLCTLGSLNPFGTVWPLVNVPVNPKGEAYYDPNLLMLGDVGAIYFFIQPSGKVTWDWDCG